jgi:hypothetical protein
MFTKALSCSMVLTLPLMSGIGQCCTYVLRSAKGNAGDALDVLQSQLGDGLASLLLVAGVHSDGGTCGDARLLLTCRLSLGLVAGFRILNLCDLLVLVGELFDTWVGHGDMCGGVEELRNVVVRGWSFLRGKLPRTKRGNFGGGTFSDIQLGHLEHTFKVKQMSLGHVYCCLLNFGIDPFCYMLFA